MRDKIISMITWILLWLLIVYWFTKYTEKNEVPEDLIDFSQLEKWNNSGFTGQNTLSWAKIEDREESLEVAN